ncbi:MAG: hypothetical protein JSU97_09010 [Dehalococcoidia bacterium]|nr:MAG: hypothetical protein JSU97_09010 [Dehalococcoidia bacterium]
MLMAQLRGKLPTDVWLGSEDLLTSAVFGTLKNLPASATAELLSRAQPLEGSTPLLLSAPLHWHFWPWWDVCEPDVVVEDEENLCIIEAKLYSDFGEDATAGSQLRREWNDGFRRAQQVGKRLWLVTLTNHASFPEEAIRRQLARAGSESSRVCWLSWSEIGRFLDGLGDELAGGWREDLLELLSRMGLAPFDGFGEILSYSALIPTSLPWTERLPLGEEKLQAVGFGPALLAARECSQRGGAPWRLKLT